MQHRYTSALSVLLITFFMAAAGNSQAQDQLVVSGAGLTAVNGTYTYGGISNGQPYYTMGSYRIEYRNVCCGLEWDIYNVGNTTLGGVLYYKPSTFPVGNGWLIDNGTTSPAPTVANNITFTGGASYTAPRAPSNSTNNPIGRFFLDPGASWASLSALTIQLSGATSQLSNVKLWSSGDNTFNAGSDAQLSSKTAASSVTFNSFSSSIASAGTYYFITADVIAGGYGNVSANIANASAFTLTAGTITTSISSAALSNGVVILPLQLLSFTAQTKEEAVILSWTASKEENFSGYELERSADGTQWNKLTFIPGKANNTNTTQQYTFTDNNGVSGHSFYRLKMVDIDGSFTYSKLLTVKINSESKAAQSYPNPFIQSTSIAFQLPVKSNTTLKVYNATGVEISTLISRQLDAGNYTVAFDGTSLPAGMYRYILRYGTEVVSGMMLKK